MRIIKILVLLMAIAFVFLVPVDSFANVPKGVVKIGDITKITGDVLVRTKGKWTELKAGMLPYAVFNTDKIVTKRGRAQVDFVDGGNLKLNVNSNISIIDKKVKKGIFSKKLVTSRQINVLVGDVWFDIKVNRDKRVTFKTPSMTAALRGTSGQVSQGLDAASSSWGLESGSASTSGVFAAIQRMTAFNVNLSANALPALNQAIASSPLIAGPAAAAQSQNRANQAASNANAGNAQAAQQAAVETAGADVAQVATSTAQAALAVVEAAEAAVESEIVKTELALAEAERINDPETVAAARAELQSMQAEKLAIVTQKVQTQTTLDTVRTTAQSDPAAAALAAQVMVTQALTTSTRAAKVGASSNVVIAQSSGNAAAVANAKAQAQAATQSVASASNAQVAAENIEKKVKAKTMDAKVAQSAASTISVAATAIATDATVKNQLAAETTSGDQAGIDQYAAASAVTGTASASLNTVINDIKTASESSNPGDLVSTVASTQQVVTTEMQNVITGTQGLVITGDQPTPVQVPVVPTIQAPEPPPIPPEDDAAGSPV